MNIIAKEAERIASENGAVKYSTSGDPFVDDFSSISKFRDPRTQEDVNKTMNLLWAVNPLNTLKEMLYIRSITRDTRILTGVKLPNKGQGLKHEFFSRIIWLAEFHPDSLYKNLPIFVAGGSWDDVFEIMRYDLRQPKRVLDWNKIFILINEGLQLPAEKDLIKKYLPTRKSQAQQKTARLKENALISNFLAKKLWPNAASASIRQENYRHFKASGLAHTFQQQIAREEYQSLDFNKIPGRVLNTLIKPRTSTVEKGKVVAGDGTTFIERHGLTAKFDAWLDSQPVVKFKGFPYELFHGLSSKPDARTYKMLNKQFVGLLQDLSVDSNLLACIDVSGSMKSPAVGLNGISAYTVACSMALSFAYQLKGKFAYTYMAFSNDITCKTVTGKDPVGDYLSIRDTQWPFSGTDFLLVAIKLAKMKQEFNYAEEEFPSGVICISDGEFNFNGQDRASTFQEFKRILATAFSEQFVENFKLILWDVPNSYYRAKPEPKFEADANYPNFFYLSGFDPAGLSFLTGIVPNQMEARVPQTAAELFATAMNQDLLNLLLV